MFFFSNIKPWRPATVFCQKIIYFYPQIMPATKGIRTHRSSMADTELKTEQSTVHVHFVLHFSGERSEKDNPKNQT